MEWLECAVADDCAIVPSNNCCGCADIAVNRRFETEARTALNSIDLSMCGPVGCATQGCHLDARAGCNQGSCVTLPGCSQRQPTVDDCEGDATCQLYSARQCQNSSQPPFPLCATPRDRTACDPTPTCRVYPDTGVMLLFADGCVPPGWEQACPTTCQ
jgi:hypothetical protein